MMVRSESILITTGIAGLIAGVFLGYQIGNRKKQHHYLYEFKDVEDYGDEEEDYDVFSHNLIDEDELANDFRPAMKAEPVNYER